MWHGLVLGREFFEALVRYDEQITQQVAAAGCPHCGGRLHRSDYERKPRGGTIAAAGEAFGRRFSLCCSRAGCRKRLTPPSLRFLGRRVYLGAAVLVACAVALPMGFSAALRAAIGIPAQTVRRWDSWWRTSFVLSTVFVALRGQLMPPVNIDELPRSLLERLGGSASERVERALRLVAPLSTSSVADGARFLRVGAAPAEDEISSLTPRSVGSSAHGAGRPPSRRGGQHERRQHASARAMGPSALFNPWTAARLSPRGRRACRAPASAGGAELSSSNHGPGSALRPSAAAND